METMNKARTALNELGLKMFYFGLAGIKSFGTALLVLSSLLISFLLIHFYNSPYDFAWQANVFNLIDKTKKWIFYATWIFSFIVNYKELKK